MNRCIHSVPLGAPCSDCEAMAAHKSELEEVVTLSIRARLQNTGNINEDGTPMWHGFFPTLSDTGAIGKLAHVRSHLKAQLQIITDVVEGKRQGFLSVNLMKESGDGKTLERTTVYAAIQEARP